MKEDRNEAYQRLHGFKPLKRTSKKQGETDWFYFDPRGARTVSDMKKINVESEISVNPMIKEILAYDMAQNPEDYYIWRTKDDDKVRSSHAARDGKIFNYNVPPEGGNPGEDYNCRCWAEPYHIKKHEKPDTSKVDLSGLPQYEEYKKMETRSNFTQAADGYAYRCVKFRSAEEENLLRRIGKQIIDRESTLNHAYLDSSGYITTGNGALIDDWSSFKKVHWLYQGRPATEVEKWTEFKRMDQVREYIISEAKALTKKYNRPYTNPFQKITADKYEENAILYITKDEADYLMYSHLQKDYDNLKRYLPEIDKAPQAAQDVAFDIQYNPGITATTWTNFKKYFNEKNIPELAKQVNRIGVSESRNNEMRDKILSIKKW